MLDFIDLIDALGDILTALASWRILLAFALGVGIILVIWWKGPAPWDLVLSAAVALIALTFGIIWERRS